ncbi:hypothetical protein [uncultured Croceitalea sp.]|uniref:hypothetical protein n=1 Tax=uncultured Croceitalea sp. TaxID=1798908 RepID=UPI003305C3A9
MKKQIIILGLLIITLLTLSSCGVIVKAKARNYATIEKGAIPANFGENNSIVLFMTTGKKSYDKYLKSNIRKVYNGDYELVHKFDLNLEKYTDKSKYRFIFDFEKESYSYHSNNQTIYGQSALTGANNATGQVRRFAITDRTDDKKYVMKMTSGFWSKLQRMYLKNMEEVRAKNNGITLSK